MPAGGLLILMPHPQNRLLGKGLAQNLHPDGQPAPSANVLVITKKPLEALLVRMV
jgi:hypothetical protein